MNNTRINTIRENVRHLMERDGIPSENALAKKAKVDQKTINNLLASDTLPNPTMKVLEAIADTFKVEPWMLWVEAFDFGAVGARPLCRITSTGYRLLSVFESLPDDKRKTILDFALFQINDTSPVAAKQIRDTRTHYKALPRPTNYPGCNEDFE